MFLPAPSLHSLISAWGNATKCYACAGGSSESNTTNRDCVGGSRENSTTNMFFTSVTTDYSFFSGLARVRVDSLRIVP